jgi:hypothetical protein
MIVVDTNIVVYAIVESPLTGLARRIASNGVRRSGQSGSGCRQRFSIPTAAFSSTAAMPIGISRFQPMFINWS